MSSIIETKDLTKVFRRRVARVLSLLGSRYSIDVWAEASTLFRRSGEKIKKLCEASLKQNRQQASSSLLEIASIEEQAYRLLKAA
jgi:hypothetical protein